jgi:hypothetical protein
MMLDREDVEDRMGYHKISDPTDIQTCADLRDRFIELGVLLTEVLPEGRSASVAITKLEDSLMWAIKAIALEAPLDLGN